MKSHTPIDIHIIIYVAHKPVWIWTIIYTLRAIHKLRKTKVGRDK